MTPIEDRAAWKIHADAADAAKADGRCYACQQHAGFRAVEAAGLSEPTLDLYVCDKPSCNRKRETP